MSESKRRVCALPYTHPAHTGELDFGWCEGRELEICTVPDTEKPMAFRGTPYCSIECGKRQGIIK